MNFYYYNYPRVNSLPFQIYSYDSNFLYFKVSQVHLLKVTV